MEPELTKEQEILVRYLNEYKPRPVTEVRKHLRQLAFGDWGTGKTTLACASGRPTLHLSTGDKGYEVLKKPYSDYTKTVPLNGIAHLKGIGKAIQAGIAGYDKWVDGVVVIDTVSGLCQKFNRNQVDYTRVGKSSDRMNISLINAKERSPDYDDDYKMEVVGRRDYNVLTDVMFRAIYDVVNDIPADVIWLAWEKGGAKTDEKGNEVFTPFTAKMPEGTKDIVAESAHLVSRLYKMNGVRKLASQGDNRAQGKSRITELEKKELVIQDKPEEFWKIIERWRNGS